MINPKTKTQNPKKILNPNHKNFIWNLGFVFFLEIGILDLGFQIQVSGYLWMRAAVAVISVFEQMLLVVE